MSVVAAVEDLGDVGMVHQRQRLPLGLEAGDDLPGVHARLDDLQATLRRTGCGLLGHEDHAEAALADLLQQLVRPDDRARCPPMTPGGPMSRSASKPVVLEGTARVPILPRNKASTLDRSSSSAPHARSRYAWRSPPRCPIKASQKMDLSSRETAFIGRSGSIAIPQCSVLLTCCQDSRGLTQSGPAYFG